MSFTENLTWRYATKKFDGRKISDKDFATIKEAIRFSPSSRGLQPYHINIAEDQKLRETLAEASTNESQIKTSSHLLIFSARTDVLERIDTHVENTAKAQSKTREELKKFENSLVEDFQKMDETVKKMWAVRQTYIAFGFALAACAELKIDSCPMEGFDKDKFKKILNLPEYIHPQAMLAIGYRADDDKPRIKVRFSEEDLFGTK